MYVENGKIHVFRNLSKEYNSLTYDPFKSLSKLENWDHIVKLP